MQRRRAAPGSRCPDFMAEVVAELSASWPARAPTSTSAPACRSASPSPTTRPWSANAAAPGPAHRRARGRAPASATSAPSSPPPRARSRSRRSRRAARSASCPAGLRRGAAGVPAPVSHRRARSRSSAPSTRPRVVHAGDDLPPSAYAEVLAEVPALERPRCWPWPAVGDARRGGQRRRSSSSRGSTSPSASTRRPPGPGPPTGAAGDVDRGARSTTAAGTAPRTVADFDDEPTPSWPSSTDDLLDHGDLDAALRRLLTSGFADAPTASRSRDCASCSTQLRRAAPGGARPRATSAAPSARSPQELDEVVAEERDGHRQPWPTTPASRATSAARRSPTTWPPSAACELDLLPDDLAGHGPRPAELRLRLLRGPRALRGADREAARGDGQDASSTRCPRPCPTPTPSSWRACARCFDALNRMLEQREAGEDLDPTFESFMEQFGDMFPGNPQTLDELLEQLAAQMAAAQAVWNSMSPEQRAQLQAPGGVAPRGHGPALAGGPPGREPPPGRARGRLGPALPLQRRRPHGPGRGDRPGRGSWARWTSSRSSCARPPRPAALAEVDLDQVAEAPGRGRGPVPRPPGPPDQAARGGRPDRAARGPLELTALGHPPHRPEGADRPVPTAHQGPPRRPPQHLRRAPATTRGDDQALRVRRPVQPRPPAHRAQRRAPVGRGHAGAPRPRGLRGRRDRGT